MDEIVEAWAVWMGYYQYLGGLNRPYSWRKDNVKLPVPHYYMLYSDTEIVEIMNQYMRSL